MSRKYLNINTDVFSVICSNANQMKPAVVVEINIGIQTISRNKMVFVFLNSMYLPFVWFTLETNKAVRRFDNARIIWISTVFNFEYSDELLEVRVY